MENCLNFFSLVDRVTGVSKYWYFLCCCEIFFLFFVSKMCFYALFWNLENLENGNFYQEINVKNLENLENGQLRPKKNLENGTFQPGKTWKMTPESLWPPWTTIRANVF